MKKVAIFIDHENLRLSLIEAKKEEKYNIEVLVKCAGEESRIIVGKAYVPFRADTCGRNKFSYNFYQNGIEPVYTPAFRSNSTSKSLGDPMLVCDVMENLYEHPSIDLFIICSGDKDVIPVLRKIAEKGKEAIVIGVGPTSADALCKECTRLNFEFIDYLTIHKPILPGAS